MFNPINWGKYFLTGMRFYTNLHYTVARAKDARENTKEPSRTAVLNFLLASFKRTTDYLEIGVGVFAKTRKIGDSIPKSNDFYEYSELEKTRVKSLNLTRFEDFKRNFV